MEKENAKENIDLRTNQKFEDLDFQKLGNRHMGFMWERTKYKDKRYGSKNMEKVFYQQWKKECKPSPGVNQGHGMLQNLFFKPREHTLWHPKNILYITSREKFIVATVMQWLGTNVGFNFLQTCLDKCGYKIVKKENK